jgi:hypothetical protein
MLAARKLGKQASFVVVLLPLPSPALSADLSRLRPLRGAYHLRAPAYCVAYH